MKEKFIRYEESDASVFYEAMQYCKDLNLVRNFVVSMRQRDKFNSRQFEAEPERD